MFVFALLCGYLAACFILAACVIRMAKTTVSAQQISDRVWLFPALPLLLVVDALVLTGEILRKVSGVIMDWFDGFSGRRNRTQYGYFSYGYVPPARKIARSKPAHRSSGSQRRRA